MNFNKKNSNLIKRLKHKTEKQQLNKVKNKVWKIRFRDFMHLLVRQGHSLLMLILTWINYSKKKKPLDKIMN